MISITNLSQLNITEKNNLIYRKTLDLDNIIETVIKPIADDIAQDGLAALKKYSLKFDSCFPDPLVLDEVQLQQALNTVQEHNPEVVEAFSIAQKNIEEFHRLQIPKGFEAIIADNVLGYKYIPFDRVALYVPGGKALYPSTVLMGVIAAKLAGVQDITVLTPPDKSLGRVNDSVLAMASLAGATRVIQSGGSQSVLAAALGIDDIGLTPVDFIFGPGNVYVAAAKSYVAAKGYCGIDSFAGPSEVLIIADSSARPEYIAHDLLAQAEHDQDATSILLTDDQELAEKTIAALEQAIIDRSSDRKEITIESMKRNGKILLCHSLEEAISFSNEFAPEHLEIQTRDNDAILENIRAAGSIFMGEYAPVAIGDYYSGTNHILPTNRAARFASGVSVQSFYRRITYQKISEKGLRKSQDAISTMSKVEGLFDEHGYSVLARFKKS